MLPSNTKNDIDSLKTLELRFDGRNQFGVKDGTVYKLGKITFEFIQLLKSNSFADSMAKTIEAHQLSEEESDLLKNSLERLADRVKNPTDHKTYLRLTITVVKDELVVKISKKLTYLFNSKVVIALSVVSIAMSVSHIWLKFSGSNELVNVRYSSIHLLVIFLGIMVIALIHELGHSVATYVQGIRPREIGFGFYAFFPVLYSNVTEIWVLNKFKRILVNSAGIYFQLIAGIALTAITWVTRDPSVISVVSYLVILNLFMMVYSLIPFIRNDGYWIISDMLEISDLNAQSNRIFFLLIKGKISSINKWLLLYSILSYAFIAFLAYTVIRQLLDSITFIQSHNGIRDALKSLEGNGLWYVYFLISIFFSYLLCKSFLAWIKLGLKELREV